MLRTATQNGSPKKKENGMYNEQKSRKPEMGRGLATNQRDGGQGLHQRTQEIREPRVSMNRAKRKKKTVPPRSRVGEWASSWKGIWVTTKEELVSVISGAKLANIPLNISDFSKWRTVAKKLTNLKKDLRHSPHRIGRWKFLKEHLVLYFFQQDQATSNRSVKMQQCDLLWKFLYIHWKYKNLKEDLGCKTPNVEQMLFQMLEKRMQPEKRWSTDSGTWLQITQPPKFWPSFC